MVDTAIHAAVHSAGDGILPDIRFNQTSKKHCSFNKRFNADIEYQPAFEDGSEVKIVPGTEPEKTLHTKEA